MVFAVATARDESAAQLCATDLRLNLRLIVNRFAAKKT
jgi:hypothetical protein